jgi:hypothetical protein
MARGDLTSRELEILRTLARVHFMTTPEIKRGFFSDECGVQERVTRLARLGLICRHSKGVPSRVRYSAWRLTAAGISAALEAFPGEQIPRDLAERLHRKPLLHHEHREALTSLYLDLICGAGEYLENPFDSSVEIWMNCLRHRAEQLTWHCDAEVVIDFRQGWDRARIVPDATVTSPAKRTRLFIELDRSNKGLKRVAEDLGRYASFLRSDYGRQYRDGFTPWVVYVVLSEGRREGVLRLTERLIGGAGHRSRVLVLDRDAKPCLACFLLRDEDGIDWQALADEACLRDTAAAFARGCRKLLRDRKFVDALRMQSPTMFRRWERSVRDLAHEASFPVW